MQTRLRALSAPFEVSIHALVISKYDTASVTYCTARFLTTSCGFVRVGFYERESGYVRFRLAWQRLSLYQERNVDAYKQDKKRVRKAPNSIGKRGK